MSEPSTKPRLRPNTPAWLVALAEQNPKQAMMTKAIVNAAGREDVCSICGDQPSSDYRYMDATTPVDSIRLCEDCRDIQAAQGAKPVPIL
jgi:hypothetical protein